MKGWIVRLAACLSLLGASSHADAIQLRSSAIGSAGAVVEQAGRTMGFTVGLSVAGIISASGRQIISGFWRWELQGPAAADETLASVLPRATVLGIAYPNPMRDLATIPVQIAGAPGASALARLEVFDIAGRRVSVLIDATLEPGFYSSSFDRSAQGGERLGSGVYFVRLTSGEMQRTTRLVVID